MYCSSCGSQIQSELNYCNRCGAKVSGGDPVLQKSVADNLSGAIGYIPCMGFIAFIFVVYLVLRNGGDGRALIPISFFYLATVFGITYLLLQHVAQLTGKAYLRPKEQPTDPQPAYLKPVTTAQLEESREPGIGSVTENTTRTLDEVLVERK